MLIPDLCHQQQIVNYSEEDVDKTKENGVDGVVETSYLINQIHLVQDVLVKL